MITTGGPTPAAATSRGTLTESSPNTTEAHRGLPTPPPLPPQLDTPQATPRYEWRHRQHSPPAPSAVVGGAPRESPVASDPGSPDARRLGDPVVRRPRALIFARWATCLATYRP